MPRQTENERIARRKRVVELHQQGLSLEDIRIQVAKEGFVVTRPAIHQDLKAVRREQEQEKQTTTLTPYATTAIVVIGDAIPFYCKNKGNAITYPNCCFNHKIGMPGFTGKRTRVDPSLHLESNDDNNNLKQPQIFDYQLEIFNAIADNKRLAIVKSRRIGCTEIVLRGLLYHAVYGFIRGHQAVIVPGTRQDLANRHIHYLLRLLENGGYRDLVDYDRTKAGDLYFKDDTEIVGMPSNSNALRGLPDVIAIFMDEAAHFDVADQASIMDAVEPSLAITNGNLVVISTPRGKRGFFYSLISGENSWKKLYFPYTVTLNKLINADYIKRVQKDRTIDFQQEYNCQFSTPENAVYPHSFMEESRGNFELTEFSEGEWRLSPMQPIIKAVGGLDIARTADFTAFTILGQCEDKIWRPLVVKIYPHITWPIILADIKKLHDEFNVSEIAADRTALGKGFIDFVVAKEMVVEDVNFSMQSKSEMINHNKKLFQNKELLLPEKGCDELILQFEEQQQTDLGGGVRYSHPEGRHDDTFWAWHLAALKIGERSDHIIVVLRQS